MDCGFAIELSAGGQSRHGRPHDTGERRDRRAPVHARETGEAIQDCGTGLIIARRRLGNVTFWVKYEERDGGYLVHSAYSHRMNVQTR
jgi:hypothetical protein